MLMYSKDTCIILNIHEFYFNGEVISYNEMEG